MSNTIPTTPHEDKWIILPVAIPGCGKGLVNYALKFLFGFGCVSPVMQDESGLSSSSSSSDDSSDGTYISRLAKALEGRNIVIADRYHHRTLDRKELDAMCAQMQPRPKLLALNWDLSSLPGSTIHAVCLTRIQPSPDASSTIWRYIDEHAPLVPSEVDAGIDLVVGEDIICTIARIVAGVGALLRVKPHQADFADRSRGLNQFLLGKQAGGEKLHVRRRPQLLFDLGLFNSEDSFDLADTQEASDSPSPGLLESSALVVQMTEISRLPNPTIIPRQFHTPDGLVLTSWKIQKTAFYRRPPSNLPVTVRGLWTRAVAPRNEPSVLEDEMLQAIAARGYDKFYDINETPWTTWTSLRKYMAGPFHVTPMLGGSLILISALSMKTLLVTSKHSFGPQPNRVSHATMGEQWLRKQLDAKGKSMAALAKHLWRADWTLMCQLLDDEFEEGVVETPDELSGLHLHGINHRTVRFKTEEPAVVAAFAEEWGFISTAHAVCRTISDVEVFQRKCAKEKGRWKGAVLQALVVRTSVRADLAKVIAECPALSPCPPPASPGDLFFFKMSFDHDYELWSHFRKITLAALASKNPSSFLQSHVPTPANCELFAYQFWLKDLLLAHPTIVDGLRKGHGFIALRKRFLLWSETPEGASGLRAAQNHVTPTLIPASQPALKKPAYGAMYKSLVLLVGLPGCGKTFISRGLSILFGFHHVQFAATKAETAKESTTRFLAKIKAAHRFHDVVIADGHSHRAERRRKLRHNSSYTPVIPPMIFAIHWRVSPAEVSTAKRVCSLQLHNREPKLSILSCDRIVRHFYAEYDPLKDTEVNYTIQMQYGETKHASLARAAAEFADLLGIKTPSDSAIAEAIKAIEPVPADLPYGASFSTGKNCVQHFALMPEMDTVALIRRALLQSGSPQLSTLWRDILHAEHLIYTQPRVTIVHPKVVFPHADREGLLDRCHQLPAAATFHLSLTEVFFDERVLAARVRDVTPSRPDDEVAANFVATLPGSILTQLHVVLARHDTRIAPASSAIKLLQLLQSHKSGVRVVPLDPRIQVLARLQGFGKS